MILPNVEVKRILYTTDLSESARYALAYAVSLANSYRAELTILHVLADDPNLNAGIVGYIGEEKWEAIKNRNAQEARSVLIGKKREDVIIREVMDEFCKSITDDIGEHEAMMDETLVLRGNPVDVIVSVAEERKCDLIVMGSYGHGGLAGAIMGSTAQRVLRRSDKPVLVVHLPEDNS
ncbi:universal stress protein [Desulfonema ishimotonii]|uniref:Universal stress protein n=1 Tax=Desulfonema ishimotonii TaxID=45657 RepID=A0A401G351_9BACT|nr:universal stress protein [Desulfonema ishimotonii]GBC63545.1 universal stress protein [Desulfonema ishimotonii]